MARSRQRFRPWVHFRGASMRITKKQLRKLIRESFHDVAKDPETIAKFQKNGYTDDGRTKNKQDGLGPLEWGMYTPQSQEEVDNMIEATIQMNQALELAVDALMATNPEVPAYAENAYYDHVQPVQSTWSKTGAADTEGRERAADWFEGQGWEWN